MIRTAGFTRNRRGNDKHAGDSAVFSSPLPYGRNGAARGAGRSRVGDALGAVAVVSVLAIFTPGANAAPCAAHTAKTTPTRAACLAARARIAFPARPTWAEFAARATAYEEATLLRIGECEMGNGPKVAGAPGRWSRLRWGLDLPTYSTAFGIANVNGAYIRSATGGYSFPGATPAEEALGALALARRYGFSAWSCF
jgi:hypothetical protein